MSMRTASKYSKKLTHKFRHSLLYSKSIYAVMNLFFADCVNLYDYKDLHTSNAQFMQPSEVEWKSLWSGLKE